MGESVSLSLRPILHKAGLVQLDPFGAELRGLPVVQPPGPHPAPHTIAGLPDGDRYSTIRQFPGGGQSREPGTNHHNLP